MKFSRIYFFAAAAGLALLAGCAKQSTLSAATQTVDAFYQAIKAQDFEAASGYFMDSAAQPRQLWQDQLRDQHEQLGDLQAYTLQNKIINTVFSGTRYTLTYKVDYSKHDAVETLILFEGVERDAPVVIEAMSVKSPGL